MLTLITALYVVLPVRTPEPVAVQEQLGAALDGAANTTRLAHALRGAVVRDPRLLRLATKGEVAFARAEDDAFRSDDVQASLREIGYTKASGPARNAARAWLDSVWPKPSPAPRQPRAQTPPGQASPVPKPSAS